MCLERAGWRPQLQVVAFFIWSFVFLSAWQASVSMVPTQARAGRMERGQEPWKEDLVGLPAKSTWLMAMLPNQGAIPDIQASTDHDGSSLSNTGRAAPSQKDIVACGSSSCPRLNLSVRCIGGCRQVRVPTFIYGRRYAAPATFVGDFRCIIFRCYA